MIGPPQVSHPPRSAGGPGGPVAGATRADSKAFRRRVGRSEVLETRSWLTQRDRDVCNDVYEYKVMTSRQLQQLHFPHPRIASRRLLKLFEHQILDRFRPREGVGSAPYHYVLGELGAHVIAGERGVDLKRLRDRRRSDLKLAFSPRLRHLVEVNEFFTRLIVGCRSTEGYAVRRWWSERRCASECRDVVRPDGLGEVACRGISISFFLELDRGTERGERLAEKLRAYEWLARINGRGGPVVAFVFPSVEREVHARQKLLPAAGLVVATTRRDAFAADPLGPVWLCGDENRRRRLIDLPGDSEGRC